MNTEIISDYLDAFHKVNGYKPTASFGANGLYRIVTRHGEWHNYTTSHIAALTRGLNRMVAA